MTEAAMRAAVTRLEKTTTLTREEAWLHVRHGVEFRRHRSGRIIGILSPTAKAVESRQLRAIARAKGVCQDCRTRKATPGTSRCAGCARRRNRPTS